MKKVLWIVGGLIGLLIVVALAAPFFVDLNDYKAEIAAQAKKATGRDLAIDGDISLSILPTPGVTVSMACASATCPAAACRIWRPWIPPRSRWR